MNTEVLVVPRDLRPDHLDGAVVVFDVLRATTSMAAALAAGVKEIRVFGDISSAQQAACKCDSPRLLCGEENCLAPAGFDLGNSPGAFTPDACAGRVMLMSTTNGTRAILAARGAKKLLTGALVNASAVARVLHEFDLPVTLLCAGTNGQAAMEDVLGAGAVIHALRQIAPISLESDTARIAARLFESTVQDLHAALSESQGGQNVLQAGLAGDIDFAARVSVLDVVGSVAADIDGVPVIRRMQKCDLSTK